MVQINGKVILIFISIQLEVDHHSMPIAGDGIVVHVYGGGYAIQRDGVVDHLMIAGGAELDDQVVPLANDRLAWNRGIDPSLMWVVPYCPKAISFHSALSAKHHGVSGKV